MLCYGLLHRAINGVKDMVGFRQTFKISYSDGNETAQCEDDVETSAVLVGVHQLFLINIVINDCKTDLYLISFIAGNHRCHSLNRCYSWSSIRRRYGSYFNTCKNRVVVFKVNSVACHHRMYG